MKWMRDMLKWVLLALAALSGSGAFAQAAKDYVLGPGDTIRVTVYQNQDLTLETRINENGTISYPLLGSVKLGGLNVVDAEKAIANGLREGNFVKQPQVSLLLITAAANQVSENGANGTVVGVDQLDETPDAMTAFAGGGATQYITDVGGYYQFPPFFE